MGLKKISINMDNAGAELGGRLHLICNHCMGKIAFPYDLSLAQKITGSKFALLLFIHIVVGCFFIISN
jgi:hypothetical protein